MSGIHERISIAHIPVSGPNDYERSSHAVGEDLAYWAGVAVDRGPARLRFPLTSELVVMEGAAQLAGGERLRVGDLVRVAAGTELICEVEVPLGLRVHVPSVRALGDTLHAIAERLRARPSLATGRLVRTNVGAPFTLAKATYVTAQPRRAGGTLARGPLFDALFAVPASRIVVAPVALADEAIWRWDSLYVFNPTGTRHSGEPSRPPVVEQLRATGLPAFAALEWINGAAVGQLDDLSRAATLLALDANGALDAAETLVIPGDDGWWRWQPDPAGAPVAEAIAPWLRPAAALPEPPPSLEAVLEHLLASLWDDATEGWMVRYMSHPTEVPWPVGALACPFASRLSPAFRARWDIALVCDGEQSALAGDRGIRIAFHGRDGDVTHWTVRSDFFHEHIEWSYRVSCRGGTVTSERELVSQYD